MLDVAVLFVNAKYILELDVLCTIGKNHAFCTCERYTLNTKNKTKTNCKGKNTVPPQFGAH